MAGIRHLHAVARPFEEEDLKEFCAIRFLCFENLIAIEKTSTVFPFFIRKCLRIRTNTRTGLSEILAAGCHAIVRPGRPRQKR
jgi:hypothetical protein